MPAIAPDSPPRAPPIKYQTPLGTRWQKEKAAAGQGAFDYPDDAKYVGPWIIGECVGKGASGHVKIAKHRKTGQLAAVKILPLPPAQQAKSEKQRLGIDREITMMKLMNHPNIMRIYDVYEGEKELYLILEYVEGGELFDFLVNRGKLAPLEALAYFKQIVYGLNYAHTFSIIHRDLKPENILIHSLNPPLIKIADWGMAAFAPPSLQLETSCGSPHYASPEIVNGHKYCGTATDIWSCGVILYALLTGRLPFDDKNVRNLLSKVKVGKYEMPTYIDPLAKDLLSRMLVVEVSKRITMAEILTHPWLEGQTPGITYVPAPPVSELARPLPSALHIDRDIFESLCVIWGRHADPDSIRADLLRPAGQGTLAKAFYFLLQKHREMAMEAHGILMDIDEVMGATGKVVTKQYFAPKSKKPCRLEMSNLECLAMAPPQLLRSARAAPVPPSRSPSPNALAISTDVPMERAPSAPSRAHPPSPVGPRPQKPRPVSAIQISANPRNMQSALAPFAAPQTAHQFVPMATGRMTPQQAPAPMTPVAALGSPAPVQAQSIFTPPLHRGLSVHPIRRGSAPLPAPVPGAGAQAVPPGVPVPGRTAYRSSMFAPQSAVIHAPVPVQASTNVNPILPMITAPRVPDAEMQRTFDQYANMVNMQAASWNATRGSAQPPVAQDSRAERMEICEESRAEPFAIVDLGARVQTREDADARRNTAANADKENLDGGARPHRRAHTHNEHGQGGLGFGHSVPMARELGNMVFFNDSANKEPVKEKRDRRSRPPALDLHGTPLLQKRSTFSMIGSPGPMSPPSSVIGSPVVGEFKGWFSNLFHWRVQSYLLYSVLDVFTTRNETERLLGRFGIVSVLEENDGWHVLKCRTDDSPMQDGPVVMQKQVRFRIEFSALNGAPPSASQTPRLAQNPLSPQTNSFVGPRRRNDRANDFQCVIGLVLEKGSVSIFKTIYQRLRTEWRLDALQSPRMSVPTAATPSMEQRFVA